MLRHSNRRVCASHLLYASSFEVQPSIPPLHLLFEHARTSHVSLGIYSSQVMFEYSIGVPTGVCALLICLTEFVRRYGSKYCGAHYNRVSGGARSANERVKLKFTAASRPSWTAWRKNRTALA